MSLRQRRSPASRRSCSSAARGGASPLRARRSCPALVPEVASSQGGKVVQGNLSALGVFTFVEAAILLVAVAVLFLVWARSQRQGVPPAGRRRRRRSRSPAAGRCCCSSGGCSTSPTSRPRRHDRHPVGHLRRAARRGRADRRGRARARRAPRPSRRTRRPTTSTGSRRRARERERAPGPPAARRRPRSPRCCASGPAWEGEPPDDAAPRAQTADAAGRRGSLARAHDPAAEPSTRPTRAARRADARALPSGRRLRLGDAARSSGRQRARARRGLACSSARMPASAARGPRRRARPSASKALVGHRRPAARGRSRGRRSRRGPCAPRPAPRPRRTGRCEAPTTAAGLSRSGVSASGRESQSSAFLSWPGIEWLYSGVATSTASASAIASTQRAAPRSGRVVLVVLVVRRDRLQAVELDELGLRAAAGRPPPGGAWSCGSRRAGCRRGRGPSSR